MKNKTAFPWKVGEIRDVIGICDAEGRGIANIDTKEHADMIVAAVNEKNPQVSEEGAIRKRISIDIGFLIDELKDLQYAIEEESLDSIFVLRGGVDYTLLEDILHNISVELLDR